MDRVASHPVLSCAEAKAWETGFLKDEAAEWTAMRRAGAAVATAVAEDFREIGGLPENTRMLVLVGKGHNGGDALLAAGELLRKFHQATADVIFVFGQDALRPLAARAGAELHGTGLANRVRMGQGLMGRETDAASYDLCLDGVFGFQFRLPMDTAVAELLARVNTHPRIRLRAAVDLPSGLAETNAGTVFRADFTYATGIVKAPVMAPTNAGFVGRLRYLDLGFFAAGEPAATGARILTAALLAPLAALRPSQTDKRAFGHLFVVGGSRSYPGAVVMAVRAALRSGTGLVTAFVPERLAPEYAARHPEAMWVGCPDTAAGSLAQALAGLVHERLPRATALLMGPGLGAVPETLGALQEIVRAANIPIVLDADALRTEVVAALNDRPCICTPHAGEFERIAPHFQAEGRFIGSPGVLVLKGPLTRVTDGRTIYHSPFGGPVLARGGSGDILAGLIGGLLAQTPDDPLLAACRGTVWHGRAADLLARSRGQVAVEISEILEQLGPALIS